MRAPPEGHGSFGEAARALVADANDEALTAGGPNPQPWTIEVADPSGNVRDLSFSFPAHDLGSENYPAILDAIETTVLDGAPLTFVRLSDESRWRFTSTQDWISSQPPVSLRKRISSAPV